MDRNGYYLGLDMGTSSVGWAVTDKNYNLIRAKGKDLWGIREFDEASTSVERRTKRIARRRHQRDIVRRGIVREYFHDAISAVDTAFFARIDNSRYYLEDKDEEAKTVNVLFDDKEYKDTDYFREYPTVFHLRKELMENPTPHDVRMVYLAVINLFKHRGHFLNAGISSDDERSFTDLFGEFCSALEDICGLTFDKVNGCNEIESIMGNKEISRTRKSEEISDILGVTKQDKAAMAYIKLLCGLKVDVKDLFGKEIFDEDLKYSITFNDFSYDEKIPEITETLGEEYYSVIESAKLVYDKALLTGIMKGYTYLSEARVASYEKHKQDLMLLKGIIRKYGSNDDYDMMFRTTKDGSYSAYVGSVNHNDTVRRNMKGRKQDDLYKTIQCLLKKYKDKAEESDIVIIDGILDEMNLGTGAFLPKQLTNENGVIPNQAHLKELKKILDNARGYLDFLNEVDESGLTKAERIERLYSFQIPYYVGPVSEKSEQNNGNGWVVRKEAGEVLPWNFDKKIDIDETSRRFIERLVRECTYINGEKVLPKASLMYERYAVLNEINNIRINGEKISVELKQDIYRELFEKGKKVTRNQLEKYLVNRGLIKDSTELSGVDIVINNSLASYGKFLHVFGEKLKEDKIKDIVEDIIYISTTYGDSKNMIRDSLEKNYSDVLSKDDIKKILGYKFKDWGRLSKEFIQLPGCDKNTGENVPLIRMMWETNYNMMELIHSEQYTYADTLAEKSRTAWKTLSEFEYNDLEDTYFSAPVKRMVWQTILIIKEISKIMGGEPERLFMEMTRAEDDKRQRTTSRKQMFLDLYKSI